MAVTSDGAGFSGIRCRGGGVGGALGIARAREAWSVLVGRSDRERVEGSVMSRDRVGRWGFVAVGFFGAWRIFLTGPEPAGWYFLAIVAGVWLICCLFFFPSLFVVGGRG